MPAVIRLPLNPLVRTFVNAAGAVGLSRSSPKPKSDSVTATVAEREEEHQAVAQKTLVQLVDDLDGSEAQETVSFGLDGTSYEIDLSEQHAAELRDALAPFVGAARKAGGSASGGRRGGGRRGSGRGGSSSSSDRDRTAQIRARAREQGMEVNERGRISNKIVQAYEAAH
jgi:hypothetical protein